ncbi:MAG: bifunctional oligoribonuclease/PAP phosphatase NrnA [Candidatus Cloacimonadia bacterium]|jgi:phosphoesterase RecJ-like protein
MTFLKSIDELRGVFYNEINKHPSIALLTHKNPDGDGLSTCFVLQEILLSLGHKSDVVTDEPSPNNLLFLEPDSRVTPFNEEMTYSLLIVLDSHSAKRLGRPAMLIDKADSVVVIDHHQIDDPLDGYIYNDPDSASTGLIIYQAFEKEIKALPEPNRLFVAEALYTTLLNDTNRFQNNNTDEKVFALSKELTKLGISPAELSKKYLLSYPAEYYRFLGQALATIKSFQEGKIIFFNSSVKMLEENGLTQNDTSKLTNWLENAKGCEIIVYFRELEENAYRLSLRSKSVNINEVAKSFGGGGHILASGCVIEESLNKAEELILQKLLPLLDT